MAFRREKVIAAAERYSAKGQHAKAAKSYQTIVDHDPKDTRAWLLLADSLVRSGDSAGALDKYMRVAKHFSASKDFQKALAVYRQVLNIDAERLDVQIRCAELLREMGRRADAVAMYERTAHAHMQAGNSAEAFAIYRLVVQLEPTQITKRLRLAELLSRDGIADEAVAAFQECADFLHGENRLDEYVRVAERLLYHDAERPDEIRRLARAYLATKQPRKALLKLNLLLQSRNDDMEGLELLAETMYAMGKVDKACSVIAELAGRLSKSGASNEQLEEAVRVIDRGLVWEPGDADLNAARRRISAIHGVGTVSGGSGSSSQVGLSLDEDDFDDEDDGLVTGDLSAPELGDDQWGKSAAAGGSRDQVDQIDQVEEVEELDSIEEIDDFEEVEEIDEFDELEELEELDVGEDGVDLSVEADAPVELGVGSIAVDGAARTAASGGGLLADRGLREVQVLIKYGLSEEALRALDQHADQHAESDITGGLRGLTLCGLEQVDAGVKAALSAAQRLSGTEPQVARYLVEEALRHDPDSADAKVLLASITDGTPVSIEAQVTQDVALGEVEEAVSDADDDDGDAVSASDSSLLEIEDFTDESIDSEVEADVGVGLEVDEGLSLGVPNDDDDMGASLTAGSLEHDPFDGGLDDLDEISMVDDEGLEVGSEPEPEPEPELAPEPEPEPEPELELAPEPEPEPEPDWTDITDDVEELEFYVAQELEDDARVAYMELVRQHPGHPALAPFAHLLEEDEDGAADAGASLVDVEEEAPAFAFDDDEDDGDYLASIFDEDTTAKKSSGSVAHKARAEVQDAAASDHFDLGVAYHGMGLAADAISEFDKASKDPEWACRAAIMVANLLAGQGDSDGAIERLKTGRESARNDDERSEVNYELAVLHDAAGRRDEAVAAMRDVGDGFRDRDAKLAEWS